MSRGYKGHSRLKASKAWFLYLRWISSSKSCTVNIMTHPTNRSNITHSFRVPCCTFDWPGDWTIHLRLELGMLSTLKNTHLPSCTISSFWSKTFWQNYIAKALLYLSVMRFTHPSRLMFLNINFSPTHILQSFAVLRFESVWSTRNNVA